MPDHGSQFVFKNTSLKKGWVDIDISTTFFSDPTKFTLLSFVEIDKGWSWLTTLKKLYDYSDTNFGFSSIKSLVNIIVIIFRYNGVISNTTLNKPLYDKINSDTFLKTLTDTDSFYILVDKGWDGGLSEAFNTRGDFNGTLASATDNFYWSYLIGKDGSIDGPNQAVADKWEYRTTQRVSQDLQEAIAFNSVILKNGSDIVTGFDSDGVPQYSPGAAPLAFDSAASVYKQIAFVIQRLKNLISPPQLLGAYPSDGSNVRNPINERGRIVLTFSKPIFHTDAANFMITGGGKGTLAIANSEFGQYGNTRNEASLSMTGNVNDSETDKSITIAASIRDTYGVSSSISIHYLARLVAPTVGISPLGYTVPVDANVVLTFSERMNTGNDWRVEAGGFNYRRDSGGVSWSDGDTKLTIAPPSRFTRGSTVSVNATGFTAAADGAPVSGYVLFTVEPAPTAVFIPAVGTADVPLNKSVVINFSETMKTGGEWLVSVDDKDYIKDSPGVSWNGNVLTITPRDRFRGNSQVVVQLHGFMAEKDGAWLSGTTSVSFTTNWRLRIRIEPVSIHAVAIPDDPLHMQFQFVLDSSEYGSALFGYFYKVRDYKHHVQVKQGDTLYAPLSRNETGWVIPQTTSDEWMPTLMPASIPFDRGTGATVRMRIIILDGSKDNHEHHVERVSFYGSESNQVFFDLEYHGSGNDEYFSCNTSELAKTMRCPGHDHSLTWNVIDGEWMFKNDGSGKHGNETDYLENRDFVIDVCHQNLARLHIKLKISVTKVG